MEVIYNKEPGFLIADRYNKEKFVNKTTEVGTSALDWFDEVDE